MRRWNLISQAAGSHESLWWDKTAPQEGASDNSSKQEQEPRSGRTSEGIAEIILAWRDKRCMAREGQLNVSLESDINLSLCNIKSSPLSYLGPHGSQPKNPPSTRMWPLTLQGNLKHHGKGYTTPNLYRLSNESELKLHLHTGMFPRSLTRRRKILFTWISLTIWKSSNEPSDGFIWKNDRFIWKRCLD